MTDNLDELIERLRELLAKATPGPWQYHGSHFYGPDASETAMLIGQIVSGDGRCPHDRNLVTGAINALPTLLDALAALKAERDALAAELAKAREPVWFYHPYYTETCQFGLWDVIEYCDLEPGKHVVEVETARPLPSIWCVVHVLTDKEKDALETDEAWFCTEHATEAEARAALQQKDRNDEN